MDLNSLSSAELARLCVDKRDAEAWFELIRRYQRPIALTVLRMCRIRGQENHGIIDDLIQETYLRLCASGCRLLRDFVAAPDCTDPLAALVRRVAANVCYDHFRNRTAQKRGAAFQRELSDSPDDSLLGDLGVGADHIEREALLAQVERLLTAPAAGIPEREQVIFRLYFRQGLTAKAIASIPSLELSIKGVESALHRVTTYLRSMVLRAPQGRRSGGEAQL